jgi:putative transposase
MMSTASEKLDIIRLVEDSELSVRRTLDEIKVSRTSFYRWYAAYEEGELDGLANQGRVSRRHWNRLPDSVRSMFVDVALDRPELTP